MTATELHNLKKGDLINHKTHGEVRFIKFNFGTCIVETFDLILFWGANGTIQQKYGWKEITVKTDYLTK